MNADKNRSPDTSTRLPSGTHERGRSSNGDRAGDVESVPSPVHLIYDGWLPKISGHQVNKYARSRLVKLARRVFGVLPPFLYPTTHAYVQIIRVLGPRQKPMDDDSIQEITVGLRDALKPSYIVDDSQKWATFTYRNDGAHRWLGPRIEVRITYDGA